MTERIILNTPNNRNHTFYQCVNYNCEEICTRLYIAKENSRLLFVPNWMPKILHKPYLYGKIKLNVFD
jgi:hypothetical protein